MEAPKDPQLDEIDVAPGQTLPFSEAKQNALLGHLLDEDSFFLQSRSKIRPEWFADPLSSKVWQFKLNFFAKYERAPLNMDEFKGTLDFLSLDSAARQRLSIHINKCQTAKAKYGLDVIRSEMTFWLKAQIFKAFTQKATDLYNQSELLAGADAYAKFEEAFGYLNKGSLEIRNTSFEQSSAVSFDDIVDGGFITAQKTELSNACTFGCGLVDRLLNKDCINDASLLRGDMTVLLAPTNVGKTTTMINVAIANVLRAKRVLFVTHEGRKSDIKNKMVACFTRMNYAQLEKAVGDNGAGHKMLERAAMVLKEWLVYIPLNRPGLTVEEVETAIRQEQEKCILKYGKGFDLIIDDYPAKLSSSIARSSQYQKRNIDEYIYNFFTQIALEFNCHVLTAIQTNREGSKINQARKGSEERLLTMEDVMESFGAMTTATNVISLNRTPEAEARERMTFHICKSRSNEKGWSIVTKTNFGCAVTHGRGLPATYYRGLSAMDANIDALLAQHAGHAIPDHYFFA